jgi:hypothetical protein
MGPGSASRPQEQVCRPNIREGRQPKEGHCFSFNKPIDFEEWFDVSATFGKFLRDLWRFKASFAGRKSSF